MTNELARSRETLFAPVAGAQIAPRLFGARSASSMSPLVTIDGSSLEGGGQIVRVAAALAAVTGRETRVERVRANRPKPGLAAQHLAGLHLCARACGGRCADGDRDDDAPPSVGSRAFVLTPGSPARFAERNAPSGGTAAASPSRLRADVGTAGATTLVAQAALPPLLYALRPTELRLTGGTDVPMAPPLGYLLHVLAPLLRRHALCSVDCAVAARGYYPLGGGDATLAVAPPTDPSAFPLPPLTIERTRPCRGGDREPAKLGCWIVDPRAAEGDHRRAKVLAQAALRAAVSESPSLAFAADAMASAGVPVDVGTKTEPSGGGSGGGKGRSKSEANAEGSSSGGGSVVVTASSPDGVVVLGAARTFASGASDADRIRASAEAGKELAATMESGAAVDDHALDQLVVHMALADGRGGRRSRVVARSPVSSHAKTAMAICERACGATFYAREGEEGGVGEGLVAIECVGIGAEPRKE